MIKYIKTTWKNDLTPVNASNLNKIEDGLEYLHDVVKNVPNEENIRISNEKHRQSNETTRQNNEIKRNATFDSKIKDVDIAISASNANIQEINNKFESITASQQQDAEVILARDGEESLSARLERDLKIEEKPLKDFVIDMNNMKESQDFAYQTDKGYLVCKDTQNGVVKDLKICGRSLVNLSEITKKTINYGGMTVKTTKTNLFKPNTEYTQIINIKTNTLSPSNELNNVGVLNENSDLLFSSSIIQKGFTGIIIKKATTPSDLSNSQYISAIRSYAITTDGKLDVEEIILEGDHTQNPPSYFEGIASVNSNKGLEVLTVKDNGNLCSKIEIGGINGSPTPHFGEDYDYPRYFRSNYISVESANKLSYSFLHAEKEIISPTWYFYDKNKKGIMPLVINTTVDIPSNACYARLEGQLNGVEDVTPFVEGIKLCITKSDTPKPYVPYKEDKKTILFKDVDETWKPVTELRGIDLNACDTIEKHSDGKHYLHVRTEKTVLNGGSGENWGNDLAMPEGYMCFKLDITGVEVDRKIICDKFETYVKNGMYNKPLEGIVYGTNFYGGTKCVININKSKLSQQDAEGFKQWLQSNPVTVVYELKEEKVYEVNPLDLESYDNETLLMINSGPVPPKASFKITSSITNFVKNVQERVTRVENYIYKANMANFAIALSTLDTKLRLDKLEAPQ